MKSIYSLVGVFLPLTALASQAATTTSTREVTCGITFQTSVLRNQDASKSRFDKLNIYADNFGGGGSLDALAGKRLGNQFCFNGTHLGESQQTMDNGLLLMVPEDKTSAWNRVVITGYAMGRPSGQTETGHWGASPRVPLGYLKTRPEPWAGWAGFMVCDWWQLKPQLFWYTSKIRSLDVLPKDCAAVDLLPNFPKSG